MNKKKTFWGHVRVLLVELLVGLALGVGVWELIGRRILALKYGSLGSSVTCATDVERALTEFDTGLRLSAVIGAVLFLVLTLVIRFMLKRRKKQAAAAEKESGAKKDTEIAKEKAAESPEPDLETED